MSTELQTIYGEKEVVDREARVSDYQSERLLLTSFWGGTDRGTCISLTIPSGQIQLTERNVEKLIKVLQEWVSR